MSTKKDGNFKVSLDLNIKSGHLANINDEIEFIATINNKNDYNISLTNLNFTKMLDENLLTFIEDSLTQNNNPITKNDDDSYTLEDITNNTQSIISFKATVKALSMNETKPSITLKYSYLDSNNEVKTSSIEDSFYLYLTNSLNNELNIEYNVDLNKISLGNDLTYTLRLTNNSDNALTYVFIKDIFDEYSSFVKGSVVIDDNPMIDLNITNGFEVGPIEINEVKTISFKSIALKRGTTKPSVTILSSIEEPTDNTILSYQTTPLETTITVQIIEDLSIVKSSDKTNYTVNTNAYFEIDITNNSTVDYKNLKLSDILNENLEYITDTLRLDGYSITDELNNVNIGYLDIDETKILSFYVKCLNVAQDIENKVIVNGNYLDNEGGDESITTESNTLMFNITEQPTADFKITKSIDSTYLKVNESHTFSIDLENTGEFAINNLNITESLDNHFEFVQGTIKIDDIEYVGDLTTPILINTLDIGESKTITFSVICVQSGTNIINQVTGNGKYTKDTEEIDIEKISNELIMKIEDEIDVEIEITKSINEDNLRINDTYQVTLEIENLGNTSVSNFSITESLDNHLELVPNSIKIDEEPYENDLSSPIPLGTIVPTIIKNITFDVKAINIGDNLTNKVIGKGLYKNENNQDTPYNIESNEITFNIKEAINLNVVTEKNINDTNCRVEDIRSFSIDVKNNGNILLNDVTLTDNLDSHFKLIENSITINEEDYKGNLDTPIELGDIDINKTVNVSFEVECIKEGNNILNKAIINGTYSHKETPTPFESQSNEVNVDITPKLNPSCNVTKSISKNELSVNEEATITIILENNGDVIFDDITVIDDLDEHLQFIENSITVDDIAYPGKLEDTISIQTLEVDQTATIKFNVKALSIGNDIENTANIQASYIDRESEIPYNKDSNTIKINIIDELIGKIKAVKKVNKGNLVLGDNADYTITITNTGNTNLSSIKLTDIIDSKLLLVPDSVKIDGNIKNVTEINKLELNDLAPNEETIVTYTVRSINIGDNIINMANITASYLNQKGEISELNQNSNSAVINVFKDKKGAVLFTKEVDKTICNLNDTVNFIIKFKNIGNVDLNHIHLADNFDEMFTYVENSTKVDGVVRGNIITGLDFETLKIDESHRIDFQAIVNTAYDKIPNSAVMAAYYDNVILNPITNEVYVRVLKDPIIDGALVKSIPSSNYRIDDIIPFTLTLNNTGNITYDEVTITDILSPNLKFINNSIKVDGNAILNKDIKDGITLFNIEGESVKTITVNAIATNIGNTLKNEAKANIKYKQNNIIKELELTSNEVTFNIDEEIIGNLEIEKTATYTDLNINDVATITLRLKNLGNIALYNITLYDFIPEGLEYVENSLKINYVETIGDIKQGLSVPDMDVDIVNFVTFDVKATKKIESINNKAFATFNYNSIDKSINKLSESNILTFNIAGTTLKGSLDIVKSSNLINYKLNDEATFSFVVDNNGNTENKNVIVKDNLPEEYEFVESSVHVDGTLVPGNILTGINIGNISKNSFKIVDFKAKAIKAANNIHNQITSTFTYLDDNNNPITTNKTSNTNITHIKNNKMIDIEFTNESYKDTITLNDYNIFRLNINNKSNTKLNNVTITDILTDNYKFIYDSIKINDIKIPGDITKGLNIGSINPHEKIYVTFLATGININKNIENKADISYEYIVDTTFLKENINSNIILTNIVEDIDAIVVIDKSVKYPNIYLNDENLFTLTIQNIGDIEVSNVLVKDILDNHYDLVNNIVYINDLEVTGDITDGITINSIKAGETINITFAALAKSIGDNIKNIATCSYKFNNILNEPITENTYSNEISTNIRKKEYAFLKLEKFSSESSIRLNTNNYFTIKITNIGNTAATNIKIIDLLPNNYQLVDNVMNKNNNIFIKNLEPNDSKSITYIAKGIKLGKNIENVANCTYEYINSFDTTIYEFTTSNTNVTNIIDTLEATVDIVKTQDKNNLILNDTATITLDLKNSGNTVAKSIIVKDVLPSNYVLVEKSLTYNGYPIEGNIIDGIIIPNIEPNKGATIKFKVMAFTVGMDIKNIAEVSYEYTDEVGNEISEVNKSNETKTNIRLYNTAELTLIKIAYPEKNYVGDVTKYKIYVKNLGNCPAERVSLKDTLPVQLEFKNNSVYINGKNDNQGTEKGIFINTIEPNEEVLVEFEVVCLSKETEVTNVIEADYRYKLVEKDTYVFKNARSRESKIRILDTVNDDLLIEQNVEKTSIPLWDVNNFTYKFTNKGNTDLSNVNLTNYINDQYNLIEDSIRVNNTNLSNVKSINNSPTINVGNINVGESKTVTFSAIAALPSTNILNIANSSYEYVVDNDVILGGVNSNETITNIIEGSSASIVINTDIKKVLEVNKESTVTLNITNIGDQTATDVNIKEILDDSYDLVPNSLIIDEIPSDEDIVLGITFDTIDPNEVKNISYKIIPKSIKDNATTITNINYNYIDVNDISRNVVNEIETQSKVIVDSIPNFTFAKDSNQIDYLIDDIATFRLIITNNSEIPLEENLIQDILPNNYEFIPNSVKINGETSLENINVGINIKEIEARSRKVITYNALAKIPGINIPNTANINYTYTTLDNQEITENLDSNTFNTNITENILPKVEITKEQVKTDLLKNDVNSYTITINNIGTIDIINLEIADEVDDHYEFVENSLKINGAETTIHPNYIFFGDLKPNTSIKITFDALAIKSGKNINNIANLKYDYINSIGELVNIDIDSNSVTSNISQTTNNEIIELIDGIAKEEEIIATIIEKEKLKLETILNITDDKQIILQINDSINSMLQQLTTKEEISLEKLKSILDEL